MGCSTALMSEAKSPFRMTERALLSISQAAPLIGLIFATARICSASC